VPWQPHDYQKGAVKFLLEHACGALFMDPGMGKSSITLAAFKFLKKRGLAEKMLVIAPILPCYSVWPGEVSKWTDFEDLKVVVLHGPKKEKLLKEDADIYAINPEGLDWLFQAKREKRLVRGKERTHVTIDLSRVKKLLGPNPILTIDELTKFKNHASGRFKLMKEVLHIFSRRWGLTGSPAANGLLNLFGQCYMLDLGNALGQYITQYRLKYFRTVDKNGFVWVPQPGAEDLIYERLAPLVLRLSGDDHLDLPAVVPNNIKVDLPDDSRRIYNQLEDELITGVADDIVTAKNAGVAAMKCRQIASGGIYITPDIEELVKRPKGLREWYNLHYTKIDAVENLVDELQGQPAIVAYDFGHDLDRLRERFADRERVVFVADVPKAEFRALEAKWNAGKIDLLISHPEPICRGLNLQGAGQHIIWYSLTWDYEVYDQLIRRLRRQGSKHKRIFVHHILARDTIDEAMLWALKAKANGQNRMFDALKELTKQRKRRK